MTVGVADGSCVGVACGTQVFTPDATVPSPQELIGVTLHLY